MLTISVQVGDTACSSKAREQLDWVAVKGIEEMCQDAWRWQLNNPNGYEG
jgi:UDP-glucose 4-epimerase